MDGRVPSAREWDNLSDCLQAIYPDLCDIYRPDAASEDEYGGAPGADHTLLQRRVPCIVSPDYQHEKDEHAREYSTLKFTLTMPRATDISVGDFIIVTTFEDEPKYRVTNVRAPSSFDAATLAACIRYDEAVPA